MASIIPIRDLLPKRQPLIIIRVMELVVIAMFSWIMVVLDLNMLGITSHQINYSLGLSDKSKRVHSKISDHTILRTQQISQHTLTGQAPKLDSKTKWLPKPKKNKLIV